MPSANELRLKKYLLRLEPGLYSSIERIAKKENRSMAGQINRMLKEGIYVRTKGGGQDKK